MSKSFKNTIGNAMVQNLVNTLILDDDCNGEIDLLQTDYLITAANLNTNPIRTAFADVAFCKALGKHITKRLIKEQYKMIVHQSSRKALDTVTICNQFSNFDVKRDGNTYYIVRPDNMNVIYHKGIHLSLEPLHDL
jgi:hypothetical protein